jgi:NADPH-dependent curcumin reductase CurA
VNTVDVDNGLEHMPETLGSLFRGTNCGIKLCQVAPDPD